MSDTSGSAIATRLSGKTCWMRVGNQQTGQSSCETSACTSPAYRPSAPMLIEWGRAQVRHVPARERHLTWRCAEHHSQPIKGHGAAPHAAASRRRPHASNAHWVCVRTAAWWIDVCMCAWCTSQHGHSRTTTALVTTTQQMRTACAPLRTAAGYMRANSTHACAQSQGHTRQGMR
jgi:hypothetical protein